MPVFPGVTLSTTIRATLGDAAAERRTLEELRSELAVLEQRIRNSGGTSKQCRHWNKEKRRLLEAIKAKEIAEGFTQGSLFPYLEQRQGQQICSFVYTSDNRRQIRRARAYLGKVLRDAQRERRRELEESISDETRGEIRAKSEDKKTLNLLSGRTYRSVQQRSTRSVEILASGQQDRPNARQLLQGK
ncbi:MAG TPA: hypothetical protein VFA51_09495 [Candidatus Udaeobacter sp.]|nr:hypothetical protein [Candidatus Udaeobacter sp.]